MSAMDVPTDRPRAAAPPAAAKSRARAVPFISWVALALMTTSSVASPRRAPLHEYKDKLDTAEVAG
jgi:glutamate:GABA antiporter